MRRALLLSVLLLACAHKSGGAEPAVIRDETVKEDQAELALELAWRPVAPRQVELVLKMRVIGIVETNKLVAEVYINGFNVEDGHTRWDGFVRSTVGRVRRMRRSPRTGRLFAELAG